MPDSTEKPHRHFKIINWPGVIALTLAGGISSSMVLVILCAYLAPERVISEQGANILATTFGAAIGAVATYLGQATGKRRVYDEEDGPP